MTILRRETQNGRKTRKYMVVCLFSVAWASPSRRFFTFSARPRRVVAALRLHSMYPVPTCPKRQTFYLGTSNRNDSTPRPNPDPSNQNKGSIFAF